MKLIIQLPCYNEADTLPVALKALPRKVAGFDQVEWLIINDGSRDETVAVAEANGVDHVVSFTQNKGLAKGFMAGIDRCLELGADVIVNTDADNQYCAEDIEKLVSPVLAGAADIVIGERPIMAIQHFSSTKKFLQKLGSFVVNMFSQASVKDAPSGFRAISREAALRLNVFNEYTYTIETIIQAGRQGLKVLNVPIRVNKDLRPSRLVKSIPTYIKYSVFTMVRSFNIYLPMRFFFRIGLIPFVIGILLGIRWMIFFMGQPAAHIPSLILAAIMIILGAQLLIFGFVADLISVNRKLLEDVQYRIRKDSSK